jgi:multiple sugar transport system permease protein
LQALPEEIYEAARLDTVSQWSLFRYITFPLISPILFTVIILRTVETLKMLDIPFSMTSGGPGAATQTYSFYVYLTGLRNFNSGYASALAYILLVIMLIFATLIFNRLREQYE